MGPLGLLPSLSIGLCTVVPRYPRYSWFLRLRPVTLRFGVFSTVTTAEQSLHLCLWPHSFRRVASINTLHSAEYSTAYCASWNTVGLQAPASWTPSTALVQFDQLPERHGCPACYQQAEDLYQDRQIPLFQWDNALADLK